MIDWLVTEVYNLLASSSLSQVELVLFPEPSDVERHVSPKHYLSIVTLIVSSMLGVVSVVMKWLR